MEEITTVGLDVAKSVFQVHAVSAAGTVVVRRQLKRRSGSVIDIEPHDIAALALESRKSKTELVISLLGTEDGATVDDIINATRQKHSVRGFLSGIVRKKLGLNPICEVAGNGVHRYRIEGRKSFNPGNAECDHGSVRTQVDLHTSRPRAGRVKWRRDWDCGRRSPPSATCLEPNWSSSGSSTIAAHRPSA